MEVILLEEICREQSSTNFTRKVIAGIALLLIVCLFVNEWNNVQETRQLSLVGWGLNLVLLGLWCWRVSFKYTLILYKDKRLEVITEGMFFIKRSYSVDLPWSMWAMMEKLRMWERSVISLHLRVSCQVPRGGHTLSFSLIISNFCQKVNRMFS